MVQHNCVSSKLSECARAIWGHVLVFHHLRLIYHWLFIALWQSCYVNAFGLVHPVTPLQITVL